MDFLKIKTKIEKNFQTLGTFFDLKQGTKPYSDKEKKDKQLISNKPKNSNWDKALNGRNIGQYLINYENEYVWRCSYLHSCLENKILSSEKIYFQRMRKISLYPRIVATYDDGNYHGLYTCSVIYPNEKNNGKVKLKYLLCLLISNLINRWYQNYDTDIEIKLESVRNIPIVVASDKVQEEFIKKTNQLLDINSRWQNRKNKFLRYITGIFVSLKISKNLENFFELDYVRFTKEIKKQIKFVSEKSLYEMIDIFEEEKGYINNDLKLITKIKLEVDNMVYKLYKLSDEEIVTIKRLNNY